MTEMLNPDQIEIRRDERQRRNLTGIEELKSSIKKIGQIQPIIVRLEPFGEADRESVVVLVAGERRLTACKELGLLVRAEFWENLTPRQAKEIELEENLKKVDLDWKDQVRSVAELHRLYAEESSEWSIRQTAERLSLHQTWVGTLLTVEKNLNKPILKDAQGIEQAYSLLQRQAERKAAEIVGAIAEGAKQAFSPPQGGAEPAGASSLTPAKQTSQTNPTSSTLNHAPSALPAPILNQDFLLWAASYTGPKFNLIHCDFPYGVAFKSFAGSSQQTESDYDSTEEIYLKLLNGFVEFAPKFVSYSAHILFWFSMSYYEITRSRLASAGFWVHDHPLVWVKSDNAGIVPGSDGQFPRRTYETALLCSNGRRPLIKAIANGISAPSTANPIHPSHKSEVVLKHFFSGLIDQTTDVLDPTCGSGAALRAAEDLGARSVLGLELNPDYYKSALAATQNARLLRKISGK